MFLRGLTRLHQAYRIQAKQIPTSFSNLSSTHHLTGRRHLDWRTQCSARRLFSESRRASYCTSSATTTLEGSFADETQVKKALAMYLTIYARQLIACTYSSNG